MHPHVGSVGVYNEAGRGRAAKAEAPLSPDQWLLPDAGFSTTDSQGSTSQVWLGVRIPPGELPAIPGFESNPANY